MSRRLVCGFALMVYLCFLLTEVMGRSPGYEIDAVYGSTPTIDGSISVGEWDDAESIQFDSIEVYVKHDSVNLYIGFNISDEYHDKDWAAIYIDVDHDESPTLQSDDISIGITRDGTFIMEGNVTDGDWTETETFDWSVELTTVSDMWQVEFKISYTKINVAPGLPKTIGVCFACSIGGYQYPTWPSGDWTYLIESPFYWGVISSTDNWASLDSTPPTISILSPENKTYASSSVSLNFTVDEATSWIRYSVSGQANITVTENSTLSGLYDGSHTIIVYAKDIAGNTRASEMIHFSINTQQTEPILLPIEWILIIIAIVVIAGTSGFVLYRKRKASLNTQIKQDEVNTAHECFRMNICIS